MNSTPVTIGRGPDSECVQETRGPGALPWWQKFPAFSFALSALFFAFVLVPPIRGSDSLVRTFVGVGAGLVAWQVGLWLSGKRRAIGYRVEFVAPLKSHYIQAIVQFSIYAYWGWYWRNVYEAAPLILAQLVYLYTFDALLAWTRGRTWRLGCGLFPIVLSTNLFMWFKDDWFAFQFAIVSACVLGKEFIRWNRNGKNTHIFNPSAFGLGLCSIVLIATGTTRLTWGIEVATTLARPPHIYLEIFLLGLVVQYFFSVTLMTLSAVAVLCGLNLIYTGSTGLFHFVDTNIPIAIFLGLHLLVTDPATSPRSNVGRIVFGGLYGAANYVLFGVLGNYGVPDFYDKLIPVPFLNLLVPWIDRFAEFGVVGRFTHWQAKFDPRRLNLAHMALWITLFATMLSTNFVEGPHPGNSIAFWKRAYDEGKPGAGESLIKLVGSLADSGDAGACNELGRIYVEGKMVAANPGSAAHYFARACELGDANGCENLAWQFLSGGPAESEAAVKRALERLELQSEKKGGGRSAFLLGFACETGRGRAPDQARAIELYATGAERGNLDAAKALARLAIRNRAVSADMRAAVSALERSGDAGDSLAEFYLAHLVHEGLGVERDETRALALLDRACKLGLKQACDAASSSAQWADVGATSK